MGLEALSGAGVSVCAPHYRRGLSHSSGAGDAWQADKSLHGADPREQDSPKCRALVQPRGREVWGLKPLIVPCVCQPHPCFTPMTWIA